ncbi:MAG: UMP kinase, partial [Candidatus Muiribacteriaceae bacterium]
TDTNAALRAAELECDLIIKATKVNGLYDKDPVKNPDAVFISDISFDAVIKNGYNVMDITAFTLCRDNNIPIYICNFFEQGTVTGFLNGEKKGSIIR